MHKSKLKRISLAVFLAIIPWTANAAGLGRLTVASGLGEPLSAEIELLGATPDELESLTAAIAPEAAYAVQGVERTPIQNAIQVNVSRKANGTAVLRLSSNQPITDPFVDMLIQVEWATGRLVREYTMLLDPPGYTTPNPNSNLPQAVSPATTASQPTPATASPVVSGAVQSGQDGSNASTSNTSKRNNRKPAAASDKPKLVESEGSSQTHTTSRGDTLSAIARDADAEGVSLDQMLVGIYRANKGAFADNNMNRLKVGQILRIPPPQEVQGISKAEARQEIQLQAADWNAYRKRLGESVSASVAGREGEGSQSASGKLTSAAQDKAAQSQPGSRDVVRLSKGEAPDSAASRSAQEKLNALQEEAIAKEKALQEANERTIALEKQVQDMQKLLAIKNQAMAALKDNAASQLQAEDKTADQNATSSSSQPPVQSAPSDKTDGGVVKPEDKPSPITEPKPATTPAPVPDAELIDGVENERLMLWGGVGAALLLLLGGWLYLRNKRKRNLDTFEKAILTSSGLKANTVFGSTLSSKVDSGDTSFLTDFSQTGGGMIDTHDVDPIAEAEVYMAYGRDAQAEEILRDAIAKDPKRYELHHKLLEMYAARKDTAAFETLAGEIYATIGASDPQWRKVAELGRKLDGQNPIYQGTEGGLDLDDDLGLDEEPLMDKADIENAMDFSLDDNLGEESLSSAEPVADSASDLDFGLDDAPPAPDSVALDDGNTLDFVGFNVGKEDNRGETDTTLATASIMAPTIIDDVPENYAADEDVNPQSISSDSLSADANDLDFKLDLPESPAASTIQMDIADFGNTLPGLPDEDDGFTSDHDESASQFALDPNLPAFDAGKDAFPDLDLSSSTEFEPESQLQDAGEKEFTLDVNDTVSAEAETPNSSVNDAPFAKPTEFVPDISLDFDAPLAGQDKNVSGSGGELPDAFNEDPVEEIVFESPTNSDVDLDFNLDSLEGAAEDEALPDLNLSSSESIAPAEVDFSDISLDLNGTNAEEPLPEAIAAESAEVDTKLDLVTAYMDMGDNEGARELLDEVLSEGGPQQRARAQAIMNSLGA
ncbi:FimV/HubP family polar landmark protein [Methylovorus mays]|uniref:FimV/HubP family polar landmark protein n=1 Tax=Methylovorus mays TaxID=184077 RepID=UPI001E356AEB|nr:FimV/HubP family polar landmark protein [Methylovorus mays]MCB5206155.1 peptidoglycan-binding protein [Methylovorus mays]